MYRVLAIGGSGKVKGEVTIRAKSGGGTFPLPLDGSPEVVEMKGK